MTKKFIKFMVTMIFCMSILSACGVGGSEKQRTAQDSVLSNTKASAASMAEETSSYSEILSYKTEDYAAISIANFNRAILPKDGDLSELLEGFANVIADITEEDENYEFIKVSYGSSLHELYCEQTGDMVSISDFVRKTARPLQPLNKEEEERFITEPAYSFMFSAFYSLQYNILSPETLTVGERDQILKDFRSKLGAYVNKLNEEKLMSRDIKETIAKKAGTIAKKLSTEKIELTCTIDSIEVHNEGKDSQY